MAHFQRPPNGDLGEYDADSKLAVGSLWRMTIPVGGSGAEVALYGGAGLTVRSNNENAVRTPVNDRREGDLRIFRCVGLKVDTTMLEYGVGGMVNGSWKWNPGSPWGALQVRVMAGAATTTATDKLITLAPHSLALNSSDVAYFYQLEMNRIVNRIVTRDPAVQKKSADEIVQLINSSGPLRHLVINCHGFIDFDNSGPTPVVRSRVEIGGGFSDPELFSRLRNLAGGVVWLSGCVIGNDDAGNMKRATNAGCYIVAPTFSMQLKPGLIKHGRTLPRGTIDMFTRFSPKVFTPGGSLMGYRSFLGMGKALGFSV